MIIYFLCLAGIVDHLNAFDIANEQLIPFTMRQLMTVTNLPHILSCSYVKNGVNG